jgi:hypothetical protein
VLVVLVNFDDVQMQQGDACMYGLVPPLSFHKFSLPSDSSHAKTKVRDFFLGSGWAAELVGGGLLPRGRPVRDRLLFPPSLQSPV